jgi:hypothetical protein
VGAALAREETAEQAGRAAQVTALPPRQIPGLAVAAVAAEASGALPGRAALADPAK